jgi:tRNA(Arg) A34 adenosine deaminase TadA
MCEPCNSSDGVVVDNSLEKPALSATAAELKRMLQVIEEEIIPKTEKGVKIGNKVFGAAVLDSELKLVHADTNEETTCPIFHGEVKLIFEWSKIIPAAERGPAAQSSIFLSTHEPCCMCISSILWTGFQKVYFFFPYAITSSQGIPHDINTMHELWGVNTYRKRNKYISTACIMDLIDHVEDEADKSELKATQQRLMDAYDKLSTKYHTEKAENGNNSLVLG